MKYCKCTAQGDSATGKGCSRADLHAEAQTAYNPNPNPNPNHNPKFWARTGADVPGYMLACVQRRMCLQVTDPGRMPTEEEISAARAYSEHTKTTATPQGQCLAFEGTVLRLAPAMLGN